MNSGRYKEHIDYIQRLISDYVQPEGQPPLLAKLGGIKAKDQNDQLYLAVVGEFNSGKSTFINAFMRAPILRESILPTTAAATFIEQGGKQLAVKVALGKHRFDTQTQPWEELAKFLSQQYGLECNSAREALSLLTSEQCVSKDVTSLNVYLPELPFGKGITIIDTPGFDPGDDELHNHQEITRQVVAEVADMAVVLVPATHAMSASLIDFLRTHLERYLHRCIFVITKMDTVSAGERKNIVTFVKRQLSLKLGLNAPLVCGQSAPAVLPAQTPDAEEDPERKYWQKEFLFFEQDLTSHLLKYHRIAIAEHLLSLLLPLMDAMKHALTEKQEKLDEDRKFIAEHEIVHISELVETSRQKIRNDASNAFTGIDVSCTAYKNKCMREVGSVIQQKDLTELKSAVKTMAPKTIKSNARSYLNNVNEQIDGLKNQLTRLEDKLERDFKMHYEGLEYNRQSRNSARIKINPAFQAPDIELTMGNDTAINLVIGGIIIAAAAALGVGWPVLIAAALVGGKQIINTFKESIISKINRNIEDSFQKLEKETWAQIDKCKKDLVRQIDEICRKHIEVYTSDVERLIRKRENEIDELSRATESITAHLADLDRRSQGLSEELKNMKII